jgi:hypothetical protein
MVMMEKRFNLRFESRYDEEKDMMIVKVSGDEKLRELLSKYTLKDSSASFSFYNANYKRLLIKKVVGSAINDRCIYFLFTEEFLSDGFVEVFLPTASDSVKFIKDVRYVLKGVITDMVKLDSLDGKVLVSNITFSLDKN